MAATTLESDLTQGVAMVSAFLGFARIPLAAS